MGGHSDVKDLQNEPRRNRVAPGPRRHRQPVLRVGGLCGRESGDQVASSISGIKIATGGEMTSAISASADAVISFK